MDIFSNIYKQAKPYIYEAEIQSAKGGDSPRIILKYFAKDLLSLDFKKNEKLSLLLSEIAQRLYNTERRAIVYEKIVPKDVLAFVVEAESLDIKSGIIFKEYAPIKDLGDKALNKMKKKMYTPFVIFMVALAIFNYIVGEFQPLFKNGGIEIDSSALWMADNYLLFNGIFGLIFGGVFIFIPEKLPIVKKLSCEIDGMLSAATMRILFTLGYSSVDMTPFLMNTFDLEKHEPLERDLEGLTDMLYKGNLLTDIQVSRIRRVDSITDDFEETIISIIEEKREDVLLLDEILQEIIKNLTVVLISVPIMTMMYILASLFTGVLDLI